MSGYIVTLTEDTDWSLWDPTGVFITDNAGAENPDAITGFSSFQGFFTKASWTGNFNQPWDITEPGLIDPANQSGLTQ